MNTYKLSIPTPCHESWEGMTPNAQGKFCSHCQKTVTDFTGMTAEQINTYMLLNTGKKVCGRFEKKQLENIVIQIPAKVMYSQTSFRKVFMLALLVVMGTTLLSCADDFGNKQPIEQVVVTGLDSTAPYNDSVAIPEPDEDYRSYTTGMVAYDSVSAYRPEVKFKPLPSKEAHKK